MKYSNPEAESAVLSAILFGKMQYLDKLTDEDITVGSYYEIYRAMKNLYAEGTPIDLITLNAELNKLGKGNLMDTVIKIADSYMKGENHDAYLKMVKECTARRKIREGLAFIQKQLEEEDDPTEIKANILEFFTNISVMEQEGSMLLKDILLELTTKLEEASKNANDTGYYTGIASLDNAMGGLHKGEMTVLAARPSVGKTAMGTQIGMRFASKGKVVVIFSREMTRVQIAARMVANAGEVDGHKIRTGRLAEEDWDKIYKAMNEMSKWKMYIDDRTGTIGEIRAICREIKQKEGLDLIIVDYLQLLKPTRRADTREREVAELSRGLKELSIELDIPILVLSQLNRSASNRRPTLDTLRESGAIEQDADNVVLLHKPDDDELEQEELELKREVEHGGREYVECILAKQRNGRTGLFPVMYNSKYLRFESIYMEGDDVSD